MKLTETIGNITIQAMLEQYIRRGDIYQFTVLLNSLNSTDLIDFALERKRPVLFTERLKQILKERME